MTNSFVFYFTPHEHPDTEVPFALRPYYPKDVWEKRLPAFTRKASRYYNQVFEWVWFLVFVGAMIGVPIVIYKVAYDNLPEDKDDFDDDDHHWFHGGFDRVWKARLISFASWFAVTLLCYIPIIIWKCHGKKVVNKMLKKWEKEDKALKPNQAMPSWKMRTPGFLSNSIKLIIHVPASAPMSSFHPAATLPPYIVNGPIDPNAAYYYHPSMGGYPNAVPASAPLFSQYNATPGDYPAPPPTSISGLPLFNDRDEKDGGYIPGLDPSADLEKQQFENIHV